MTSYVHMVVLRESLLFNTRCVHWELTSQIKAKLTTWFLIGLQIKEHCNKLRSSAGQLIREETFVSSPEKVCKIQCVTGREWPPLYTNKTAGYLKTLQQLHKLLVSKKKRDMLFNQKNFK